MKGDYGSMVWVNDKEGHEYVCTVERNIDNTKPFEELTEDEKTSCMDVSNIVGTERW